MLTTAPSVAESHDYRQSRCGVRSAADEDQDEAAGDDEGRVEAASGGTEHLQQIHGPPRVEPAKQRQEGSRLPRRAEDGA